MTARERAENSRLALLVRRSPLLMAAKAEIEETAAWVQDPARMRVQMRTLEVVAKHMDAAGLVPQSDGSVAP